MVSVVEIKVGHSTCPKRSPFCPMFQLRKCSIIFIGFSQFWLEQIDTKSTTWPFKSTQPMQPMQFREILSIHIISRCWYENKLCYITLTLFRPGGSLGPPKVFAHNSQSF